MDTVDTFSKISDNIEGGAFSQCLCLWTKAAMRTYGVVYETWEVSHGLSETTRFSRAPLCRSRHIGRVRRTHNCRIAMSYQAVDVSITAVIL